MHSFFSSPFWDFELTRILGSTAAGGCDTAEFLQAVGELRRHDPESWYKAWIKQAEMVLNAGLEFEQAQLRTLARGCFLRAANYFRTAPYMLYGTGDERELKCSEQSAAAFDRATKYMNAKVLSLTIPFSDPAGESLDLPAYLMLPPELARPKKQRTPLIVVLGGADSALEEMYFFLGEAAPALGYAVLLFDGPGQGRVFKHFGTHLRPDYEVVVSAVLDRVWALAVERPDTNLDLTRIALVGASMGGYYALRSAAAEPDRVAAVVAIDPFLDMWEFALTRLPTWFANAWMAGWVPDSFLDWSCRFHMSIDFPTRWEFGTTLAAMGKSSPADLLREFQRYSLKGQPAVRGGAHGGKIPILSSVECPVLLTGANTALYQSPEESTYRIAKLLVNVSEQHKEIWVPNTVGEGALTAKVGAWHALAGKLIAFLDRQLKTRQ
ncbi:alpha/beta hydrolase [Thozetella sp. PMI_491]|nr:alpha/beta hydrolase [Thozetella sp. PMI_491]